MNEISSLVSLLRQNKVVYCHYAIVALGLVLGVLQYFHVYTPPVTVWYILAPIGLGTLHGAQSSSMSKLTGDLGNVVDDLKNLASGNTLQAKKQ